MTGRRPPRSVTLNDPMPAGVTGDITIAGACAELPCELGDLAPGDTRRVVVTGMVDPAASGDIANTAIVDSPTPGGPTDRRSGSAVTATDASADLSLTKVVDGAGPAPRDALEHRGHLLAHGSECRAIERQPTSRSAMHLPDGLVAVSASVRWLGRARSAANWSSAPSAPSPPVASAVAAVVVRATGTGLVQNTRDGHVTDARPGSHADRTASVSATIVRIGNLKVSKTSTHVPGKGKQMTFLITAENLGPDEASDVAVQEFVPDGLTLISVTPAAGTFDTTTHLGHGNVGCWTVGSPWRCSPKPLPTARTPTAWRSAVRSAIARRSATLPRPQRRFPGGGLVPATGADSLPMVYLGAGLLGAGCILTGVAKRRRRSKAAT